MRVKILTFRFSATIGGFDETTLQAFIRDKEVLAFREHFFMVNDVPHLTCILTWQDALVGAEAMQPNAPHSGGPSRTSRAKQDPTADLNERERSLFNTLRDWRAEKAREEGVPAYLVFTNKHLSEIVRREPTSANALSQIPGIGAGKVKRYGEQILSVLGTDPGPATIPQTAPESAA